MIKKAKIEHQAAFDSIRHEDENGNEYWLARQLAKVLEYSEYRHFLPVIERAKIACKGSRQPLADHFEDVLEMVCIGSGAQRPVEAGSNALPQSQRLERLNRIAIGQMTLLAGDGRMKLGGGGE